MMSRNLPTDSGFSGRRTWRDRLLNLVGLGHTPRLLVLDPVEGWELVVRAVLGWMLTHLDCDVWVDFGNDKVDDETLRRDIDVFRKRCQEKTARVFRSRPFEYLQIDTKNPDEVDLFLRGVCHARVSFIWLEGEVDRTGHGHFGYFQGEPIWIDTETATWWPQLAADLLESTGINIDTWFQPH